MLPHQVYAVMGNIHQQRLKTEGLGLPLQCDNAGLAFNSGNLLEYSEEELEIHKKYIAMYKEIRNTVQFGKFYRLANFTQDSIYATQYVDDEQSVLFLCTSVNTFFNDKFHHINLDGLDKNAQYKLSYHGKEELYGGAYLMNVGLDFDMGGTLESKIIIIIVR